MGWDDAADELKHRPRPLRAKKRSRSKSTTNRPLERGPTVGNCGELRSPSPSYIQPL